MVATVDVMVAKRRLDAARHHGDQLQIDLAEAALNDLLERLSHVTKGDDQ